MQKIDSCQGVILHVDACYIQHCTFRASQQMQTYVTKVISLINRIIMDACTVSVRFSIDIMDVYEMDVRGWICVVLYG